MRGKGERVRGERCVRWATGGMEVWEFDAKGGDGMVSEARSGGGEYRHESFCLGFVFVSFR